ncbi:hypothetical protein [Nocardiopsis ansamitocini]|uniref:Uncharacterized protein n=1 Tax=Nocardiopsis ansamitocini TaxID=1670832 RepID=A0A9W6PBJ0_9ACTN|nr:hypothetical protein [Nocardiopsis ansamitocini]GLU50502.1 hypothetical protein Nans01_48530 [Nocardiopsis ansamitocini]
MGTAMAGALMGAGEIARLRGRGRVRSHARPATDSLPGAGTDLLDVAKCAEETRAEEPAAVPVRMEQGAARE